MLGCLGGKNDIKFCFLWGDLVIIVSLVKR